MKLDIEKLKGLAEAATQGEWGYDGSYVCTARIESGTKYVETWNAVADCNLADNTKFIAAANPAAVLELISEIEQRGERNVYWIDQANSIAHDLYAIRNERDQLKAENEDGLAVIRTLKAQLECYMKDAERYRLLRDGAFRPGCLSSDPEKAKYLDEYMICGDKMDAVIDAEIAKEAI